MGAREKWEQERSGSKREVGAREKWEQERSGNQEVLNTTHSPTRGKKHHHNYSNSKHRWLGKRGGEGGKGTLRERER